MARLFTGRHWILSDNSLQLVRPLRFLGNNLCTDDVLAYEWISPHSLFSFLYFPSLAYPERKPLLPDRLNFLQEHNHNRVL